MNDTMQPPALRALDVPYGGDEHGLICGFWIHPGQPTEALPTLENEDRVVPV